jgi:hypothetical protein
MPVINHPIHPATMGGKRYGCNGRREFKAGYWAPDRTYAPDGSFIRTITFVESATIRDCRYDMSLTDPKCDGCPHRGSGELYADKIRKDAA